MSPKMYCRIQRFNKAYYYLKYKKCYSLQDISYMCGYYDLSHFVNDFKEFTGQPPQEYFTSENIYNSLFTGIN